MVTQEIIGRDLRWMDEYMSVHEPAGEYKLVEKAKKIPKKRSNVRLGFCM
jgi:hypothetical protein